jgi:predicted MFS family arabinose efflux permease
VRPAQRSAVFSIHFALLNAGIGAGALLGGAITDFARPGTFEFVWLVDAILIVTAILIIVVSGAGRVVDRPAEEAEEVGPSSTYREVLRDRVFVRVLLLQIFLVTVGYAQLESAFPPFSTGEGGLSTKGLGFAFFANTATIVIAQLIVLRKLEGHRRTQAVALLFVFWSVAWALVLTTGKLADGALAVAGFAASMVVFALGETMLAPTLPAIVNDMSPDRLRGRYNALYTLCWSIGHIFGPPIAGYMLAGGASTQLFVGLSGACLVGVLLTRSLGRHLPDSINIVRTEEERGTDEMSEAPAAAT